MDLPNWVSYLQALATPALAVAGVTIAWGQLQLAHDRFQHDLYDRRMRVFESLRMLLLEGMREANIPDKCLSEFSRIIAEAEFLFGSDVVNYLGEVRRSAIRLKYIERKLADPNLDGALRDKFADEEHESLVWLCDQTQHSIAVFKPSLVYSRAWRWDADWLGSA